MKFKIKPSVHENANRLTNISVKVGTWYRLRNVQRFAETFDELVNRLLNEFEVMEDGDENK